MSTLLNMLRGGARRLFASTPITTQAMTMAVARSSRPARSAFVDGATTAAASSSNTRKYIISALAGAGVITIGFMGSTVVQGMAQAGTLHDNAIWPQYVRERVANTFGAFAYGTATTAAFTVLLFKAGAMNVFARSPFISMIAGFGALVLTSSIVRSIDNSDVIMKYAALTAFNAAVGFTISPLLVLGGGLLVRAAMMTGGIVGSLALVAANAPSDTFLMWGGPLAMGLGGICIANIASIFVPSVAAASVLYSISLYGGLVLFSGLCLYDTAVIIDKAKVMPNGKYDAVGESISIFMDAVNIFIRIATILSGGNRKK
eukprot:m.135454 g.135454  ORF g.135454 m.135454 type:complete len:317 (+) comp10021_c0_seq1:131-1081(+)